MICQTASLCSLLLLHPLSYPSNPMSTKTHFGPTHPFSGGMCFLPYLANSHSSRPCSDHVSYWSLLCPSPLMTQSGLLFVLLEYIMLLPGTGNAYLAVFHTRLLVSHKSFISLYNGSIQLCACCLIIVHESSLSPKLLLHITLLEQRNCYYD